MSLDNFTSLKIKVESSKNNESEENSIIKQLSYSKKLLGEIKRSGNTELYEKQKKEYIELYNTISESLKEDKNFSTIERKKISLEFSQNIYLSKNRGDIGKVNKTLGALSYGFNSLSSFIGGEEKINGYSVRDIKSSNEYELRLYQQELIDDILGNENGFNKEYIQGFDSKKGGNYILEISELDNLFLEGNIDITKFDSILLANYLKYKKTSGDIKPESIIDDLGLNTTSELIKIWKGEKEGNGIAKQKLEEEGFGEIVEKILNIENIINYESNNEQAKSAIRGTSKNDIFNLIKLIPKEKLKEFAESNNNFSCPAFLLGTKGGEEKFKIILTEAKKIELEEKKKEGIKESIINILNEKGITVNDKQIEKDSEELYNKIEELLNKPGGACGLDIAIRIEDFFKDKYKINVTQKDRIKLSEATIGNNIKQLNERLEQIEKILSGKEKIEKNGFEILSLSEKEKEKLIEEKEEIERKLEEFLRIQRVSLVQRKDVDSYRNKIEQGKTKVEALNELYEESEEFKKIIDEYKQNINNIDIEFGKKISFSRKKIIKENNKIENKNYYIPQERDFIKTEYGYTLILENGENIKGITAEERKMAMDENNPENAKNLVKFYLFFKELNLEGVWKYRNELIKAIGVREINSKDDSLTNEELIKFGNKLLSFIHNIKNSNNKEQINLKSINSVNEKLREFSGSHSIISNNKTFNIKGEDRFTYLLRKFGIIGGAYFHLNKFREYIK